jgi:RNA polymerase-binding transcription factor DksA
MLDTALYECRLNARKDELSGRLNAIETELELPPSADMSEYAMEIEGDEVLEGVGQAQLSELRAINAALDRIKAGAFGACTQCGEAISEARLNAVPQAALCQECIQ